MELIIVLIVLALAIYWVFYYNKSDKDAGVKLEQSDRVSSAEVVEAPYKLEPLPVEHKQSQPEVAEPAVEPLLAPVETAPAKTPRKKPAAKTTTKKTTAKKTVKPKTK